MDALEGLLLDEDGVPAPAMVAAVGVAAAALLLVTSASNPAHEAIPALLPSWFTAKDSQWSARSLADRENRWHRATPGAHGWGQFARCVQPEVVKSVRGWGRGRGRGTHRRSFGGSVAAGGLAPAGGRGNSVQGLPDDF